MSSGQLDPRQAQLRHELRQLGFDSVRFAAVPATTVSQDGSVRSLEGWLSAGMQADMHWMERSLAKRLAPDLVLPGVKSVIMLGVSYWAETLRRPAGDARWARYALYEDYHDTLKPGLVAAGRTLERLYGVAATDYRYYVDTGPFIDRGWGARAGLGFVGRNAMLISPEHGNWLFVAAVLTRLEFMPDPPIRRPLTGGTAPLRADAASDASRPDIGVRCGKCTRCLDACPTDAFAEPGVVDARRCISYQTIENKGIIPREFRAAIGTRIYGCDVCLEVCPWNRFAQDGRSLLLSARHDIAELTLRELLSLTPEQFAAVFRRTPIKRLKLGGLLRNACIVAGNTRDATLLPELIRLAQSHPLALVRAHAVWAVFRIGGGAQLAATAMTEQDPAVQAEYAAETNATRDAAATASEP